ncbi:hypothetical protein COCCADRAFT_31286 [Bipolaris zeicola 26-R-13]|uniref:Mid2 domain-containing protein n=1 Tax=Cochliobolus carbonum (strain 26-R-13) TaxID=930089 RepID=W6XPL3_COCC2|nr:uncharacterized protein COCCADRAFT_31286 [Bipolaris zeicola 26-R-13]EUC27165.1 hypothetical protein COCCADRAFT_31286 [Bipolaris zeicola 26-R-13]
MSGAFNYPREEHHVVLNVDSVVEVSWWSTFADTLVVSCYEAGDINGESEIFNIEISENGTEPWSPVYLSRRFDDWSIPAGCELSISKAGGGAIGGAMIGVTSATSQSASILALSSTVPWDTKTTPSTPPISTSTLSLNAISSLASTSSPAPPTSAPTGPVDATTAGTESSGGLSTGAKAGIGAGLGVGALLVVAAAYLFYRKHSKTKNLNDRVSYQPEAQHYEKPVGVSIAHHTGDGYNKPYSDATAWSQVQQPSQALPSELAATR